MSVVLDTTVLVDARRDDQGAIAFLDSLEERPFASEITRLETLRGLRSHERAVAERLFALIAWKPVDEMITRVAGEFGRGLRRSHPGVGVADLIVAATARGLNLPLATSNVKHFPMFPRLKPPY